MKFQHMAEFHCHLGGSCPASVLWEIAHHSGYKLEEFPDFAQFQKFLTVRDSTHNEFLSKYFPLTERLQSGPQAVELSAFQAVAKAYRRNEGRLAHLQLRFDPLKRTNNGWYDVNAIVQAAKRGLADAEKCYGVSTRLILCMDRNYSEELKHKIVDLAVVHQCDGVDVSGQETGQEADADWLAATMMSPISEAQAEGLSVTYHVGEVWTQYRFLPVLNVISVLGIKRIGHGVAALSTLAEMNDGQRAFMRDATFEVCPTVNLVTHVCTADTLLRALLSAREYGVRITLNTDNPYLVNTTLTKEYQMVEKMAGGSGPELIAHCLAGAFYLINE